MEKLKAYLEKVAAYFSDQGKKALDFTIKLFQSRAIIGTALLTIAVAVKGTPLDVPFIDKIVPIINSTAMVIAALGALLAVAGRLFASGPLVQLGKKLEEADDVPTDPV